ncbi:transglycosylase SLT domain-containing protein [Acetobacter vaccinii]|nr:transglycosylase SLT domain-containing protein [Acetobacter vaccinii]
MAAATLAACISLAATAYHVTPAAITRVLDTPAPGSAAVGVMHLPPAWVPILTRIGFDPARLGSDDCTNIAAGAWVLAWVQMHQAPGPTRRPPALPDPGHPLPAALDSCALDAAQRYHLPPILFRAILMTEGGRVGRISRNRNGSYDMGPAQINSTHLPELAHIGITREQVINDGCLNLHIGAWILARSLGGQTPANPDEFWRRVGNYNSPTPEINKSYQRKVWSNVLLASRSQHQGG